jgi:hypothetical protein
MNTGGIVVGAIGKNNALVYRAREKLPSRHLKVG